MGYDEELIWRLYMEKRGTLNLGLRFEQGVALLSTIVCNALGGRKTMKDFSPHSDRTEVDEDPDHVATPEDLFRMFNMGQKTDG